MTLELKTISALEKIANAAECSVAALTHITLLQNEEYGYQVAFRQSDRPRGSVELSVSVLSDIADCVTLYNEKTVPVRTVSFWDMEKSGYPLDSVSLVPDVLLPYPGYITASHLWNALYVSVHPTESTPAGVHTVTIVFSHEGKECGRIALTVDVVPAVLPKAELLYTQWFHADCIATYYDVPVFSERHWELLDSFIGMAARNGINMMMTPVFTPPLDTKVGTERPTVQLVDIRYENGSYSFGFDKLSRYLALYKKHGITHVEIPPLFSQWGAKFAPKIMVTEVMNGEEKTVNRFGWAVASDDERYLSFLAAFLPALVSYLTSVWDRDKIYFHISDEPSSDHRETYGKLFHHVKSLIGDLPLMDAMGSYALYEAGLSETPVVGSNHIADFFGKNIENLWCYYCCGQSENGLSNRFLAMSLPRVRAIASQLFKYDIKGFLQWGYNFYYSALSTHPIDPFTETDADGMFPAGDAYSVYPGKNGALASMRLKTVLYALEDIRAFRLLSSLTSKDEVMRLIEKNGSIDFFRSNENADDYEALHEAVNRRIKELAC